MIILAGSNRRNFILDLIPGRGREYDGIEIESVRGVTEGVDLDLAQDLNLLAHLTAGLLSTCPDHQESMMVCI